MKKLSTIFLFSIFSVCCFAQTGTVTGTVQDPAAQHFNNGTLLIEFVPNPNSAGPYTVNGGPIQLNGVNYINPVTFNLDGTGSFSLTLSRNDFIQPSLSKWRFTACPNADSACTQTTQFIAAASTNVGTSLNAVATTIQVFTKASQSRAYSDSEVVPVAGTGSCYFNTTDLTLHCWNGSAWTAFVTPGSNPSFVGVTVTGNETVGGTLGITGLLTGTTANFSGNVATNQLNSVFWVGVGPVQFTSLASCLAALPVSGGLCSVIPNYSETFSAPLVFTKNQHVIFYGPAAINQAANAVTAAHGADGFSITSFRGDGFLGNSLGVQFTYTGTASAFNLGDNGGNLFDIKLDGFDIKLNTASATAKGLSLNSVQNSTFSRLGINGSNNAGQVGLAIDGTFNFAGDNKFDAVFINGFPTGTNWDHNTNNNVFTVLNIGNVSANGTGINIVSGNGNRVIHADIEGVGGTGNAVHCGNSTNNFGNIISIYGQANNVDYLIDANCNGNEFDNIGSFSGGTIKVSGAGINNSNVVVDRFRATLSQGRLQTLGTSSTTCSVTGAGATATCSIIGGSTDSFGLARINSLGAGPTATGTLTLTLGLAFTNFTFCQFNPSSVVTAWNARATFFQTNYSNTVPVMTWDNNAVALVAGNSYDVVYTCVGH